MLATQLALFGAEQAVRARRSQRPRYTSVLADPGVAAASARHAALGCDLRSAFASFWAALPPEKRAELKARVAA